MSNSGVYPDAGPTPPDPANPVGVTAAEVTLPTLRVTPGQIQTVNGLAYYIEVSPRKWFEFKARTSKVLGGVLIACALFSAILNVVGLCIYDGWGFSAFMIGHGFVGLIFYTLAGSFAISAAKKKTTCKIVSTLVLCIIAIIFGGIIQIVASSVGVGMTATTYARLVNTDKSRYSSPWGWCGVGSGYGYDDYGDYRYGDQVIDYAPSYYYDDDEASPERYPAFIALHTLMLIAGLTQVVSAIWCSVIACRTVCCCKKPTYTDGPPAGPELGSPYIAHSPVQPVEAPQYTEKPPTYMLQDEVPT